MLPVFDPMDGLRGYLNLKEGFFNHDKSLGGKMD